MRRTGTPLERPLAGDPVTFGIIRDAGGACEVGRDVDRVLVSNARATGARTADGATIEASRAVLPNVTPQLLYLRLLDGTALPEASVDEARRFRFGRRGMQIHMVLSERPRWAGDPRLERTAIVHLTPGLAGVSRAANEADRGLLPVEAKDRVRAAGSRRSVARP